MCRDNFLYFLTDMQTSNEYLRMDSLIDAHSYKIFARNAYVGVWKEAKKAFLISRHKVGPNPGLFYEYHWDFDDQFGTVKPLELIKKCPFEILDGYGEPNEKYASMTLDYLNRLEDSNPIIRDYDSRQMRKSSAISFAHRLSGKNRNYRTPVHKILSTTKTQK